MYRNYVRYIGDYACRMEWSTMSFIQDVKFAYSSSDDSSDEKFYRFATSASDFWLSDAIANGPEAPLGRALANEGVDISDSGSRRKVMGLIGQARLYAGPPPINRCGWAGDHFAFSDGVVVSPAEKPAGPFLRSHSNIERLCGTFDEWKVGVEDGLSQQSLPLVVIILALLGPVMRFGLLRGPVIFEIILSSGREAHTLLALLRSAMGQLSRQAAGDALQFKDVLDQTSSDGDPYNDLVHPIIDCDLALSAVGAAARATQIARFHSAANQRSPPQVYLIFGTKSLAELAGADSDIAALAEARTITLTVGADRPLGIFNRLPKGRSLPSLVQRIETEAERHQGHLLQQFVTKLVAADGEVVRGRLLKLMNDFKLRVGGNDGHAGARTAEDAFALIYAVGRLAKHWRLLPDAIDVTRSVSGCYRHFLQAPPPRLSFDELLVSLANASDTVHLGYNQPKREAEEIQTADVVVRHHKAGRELMVRVSAIERVIPHWSARRTMPEVIERLVREEKRLQVKRRLVTGQKPELVYCFKLPSD